MTTSFDFKRITSLAGVLIVFVLAAVADHIPNDGRPHGDNDCGPNEIWRRCLTCEGTCDRPSLVCDSNCYNPRCQCRAGYLRDHHGDCIRPEECGRTRFISKRQVDFGLFPETHGGCMTNDDCPEDHVCTQHNCVQPRIRPARQLFIPGPLFPECSSTYDCRAGYECIERRCVNHLTHELPQHIHRLKRQSPGVPSRMDDCNLFGCPAGMECMETPVLCSHLPCPGTVHKCIPNRDWFRQKRESITIHGDHNPCFSITCPTGQRCQTEHIECPAAPCRVRAICVTDNNETSDENGAGGVIIDHRSHEDVIQQN
ncbi:Protein Y69H2.3 c [Aphelenchoides avenae]|nr:Protein Y69H2.3 c [Aphelenchus avenae]